jgi:hypothetical protein
MFTHSYFHEFLVGIPAALTAAGQEYLAALQRMYLIADRPFQNLIAI